MTGERGPGMSQPPGGQPWRPGDVPPGEQPPGAGPPYAGPPGAGMPDTGPPPPPGPGVVVPFAVPPADRDPRRTAIGLALGVVAVLLVCGGGVAGLVALVVATEQALPVRAHTAVTTYLEGLEHGDYAEAYAQVCGAAKKQQSLPQFTAAQRARPAITSFTVGEARRSGSAFDVPVTLDLAGGGHRTGEYNVIDDSQAGGFRVCGGPR